MPEQKGKDAKAGANKNNNPQRKEQGTQQPTGSAKKQDQQKRPR